MQQWDMAHVLGEFAKWAIMIAGLGISAVLSYIFYTTITPPDKPWFAYLALGLTEGGFVAWFATFMLSKHHAYFKGVAIIMVVACAIASFIVAGTELNILFQRHYTIAQNASAYDNVILALEVIFAMHVGSIMLELFGMYFARSENTFRGVPPAQRSRNPHYTIEQQTRDYAEANYGPKEERILEQRSIRQLPPARSQGTGFLGRLRNAASAFNAPVVVQTSVQSDTQEEDKQELVPVRRPPTGPLETLVQPLSPCSNCGGNAASGRIVSPGVYLCPACMVDEGEDDRPVSVVIGSDIPTSDDRKAQSERNAKQKK